MSDHTCDNSRVLLTSPGVWLPCSALPYQCLECISCLSIGSTPNSCCLLVWCCHWQILGWQFSPVGASLSRHQWEAALVLATWLNKGPLEDATVQMRITLTAKCNECRGICHGDKFTAHIDRTCWHARPLGPQTQWKGTIKDIHKSGLSIYKATVKTQIRCMCA